MNEETRNPTPAQQEAGIEEQLATLEELLEQLESETLPIEEAFAVYEKGMRVIAAAHQRLTTIEAKIEQLEKDGTVSDFTVEDD